MLTLSSVILTQHVTGWYFHLYPFKRAPFYGHDYRSVHCKFESGDFLNLRVPEGSLSGRVKGITKFQTFSFFKGPKSLN